MQQPDIWSDKNKVSKLGAEIKEIKENLTMLSNWQAVLEDAEISLEMQDEELISESFARAKILEKEVDKFEIQLMLGGEYDEADAILTINAGAGGTDAQDWASLLCECICAGLKIKDGRLICWISLMVMRQA